MTIRAFISYSHKDADLLTQLHEHLSVLQRQELLDAWTDREIYAGGVIDDHVDQRIEQAELYLLLVSSAFIQSDYCFEREFARACERQRAGDAIIVPIIVRECDCKIPALRRFKALPEDGKPVLSRHWHNSDEAFANIAAGLRALIERGPFSKSKQQKPNKEAKEKFIPDEHHVTEEQRAELRKIAEEVVDRLTAWVADESDDVVKKKKGRNFGIVWSQFNEHFNTVERGLPSLPREKFDEAKSWLLQYRASKDKNFKRSNPQKYRNALTKTIYTLAGKLGWAKSELYSFASEKIGYAEPITSLDDLGNSQLERVRDRVRYEHTKRNVKVGQSRGRRSKNLVAGEVGASSAAPENPNTFALTTKKEMPQWADHREVNLGGGRLEVLKCKIETQSPYFRFGFKLLNESARLFGDGSIKSQDANLVVHIGRNNWNRPHLGISTEDIFFTCDVNGVALQSDKKVFSTERHFSASVELRIDSDYGATFSVNGIHCINRIVPPGICRRVIVLAWSDGEDYEVQVSDVSLKLASGS